MPIFILVLAGGAAWRWHVLGRGGGMWVGYAFGFGVIVFFGFLALWAAGQIVRLPKAPTWLNVLRVASIAAAIEAVHTVTYEMMLGEFMIPALVTLVLTSWMFRRAKWGGAVCIALLLYVAMTFSSRVLESTIFTWFGGS